MTPSSATPRRTSCRRRRNAAAGGTGATARALAAGLWRHRHGSSSSTMAGNRGCPCSRNQLHGDKQYGLEKATKWDRVDEDTLFLKEQEKMVALLESELGRARARIVELEDEKRVTSKRLERFLRKLEEEKAAWKSRTKEEVRLERKHRRELEAANGRLLRELSEARLAAKQQAQSYEMERKARELMEEACSELTREVEEDQAEVELLRRECLRMREEMEEERRMLQMAEVWREERVQMKLSDAKLALENKYSHLNHLQAEMESFLSLRRGNNNNKVIGDAAVASSSLPPPRSLRHLCRVDDDDDDGGEKVDVDSVFEHFRRKEKDKESRASSSSSNNYLESPATDLFLAKAGDDSDDRGSADSDHLCSWVGTSDPSVSVPLPVASNTSDPSVSVPLPVASNTSDPSVSVPLPVASSTSSRNHKDGATKNTALIRRIWRTAITESRKNGGGCSPPTSHRNRRTSVTTTAGAAPPLPLVAAEHCSSSGSDVNHIQKQREQQWRGGTQRYRQSLKEKLMQARMNDHKQEPPFHPKH